MLREIPHRDYRENKYLPNTVKKEPFALRATKFLAGLALWSVGESIFRGAASGVGKIVTSFLNRSITSSGAIHAAMKVAARIEQKVGIRPLTGIAKTVEESIAKHAVHSPSFSSFFIAYARKDAGLVGDLTRHVSSYISSARKVFRGSTTLGEYTSAFLRSKNKTRVALGALYRVGTQSFPQTLAWYAASRAVYPSEYKNAPIYNPVALGANFGQFWAGVGLTYGIGGRLAKATWRGIYKKGSIFGLNLSARASHKIAKVSDVVMYAASASMDFINRARTKISTIGPTPQDLTSALRNIRDIRTSSAARKYRNLFKYVKQKGFVASIFDQMKRYKSIYENPAEKLAFLADGHNVYLQRLVDFARTYHVNANDITNMIGNNKQVRTEFTSLALKKSLEAWNKKKAPQYLSRSFMQLGSKLHKPEAAALLKAAGLNKQSAFYDELLTSFRRININKIPFLVRSNTGSILDTGLAVPGEFFKRILRGISNIGFYVPLTQDRLKPASFFGINEMVSESPLFEFVPRGRLIAQGPRGTGRLFGTSQSILGNNELGMYLGRKPFAFDIKSFATSIGSEKGNIHELRKSLSHIFQSSDISSGVRFKAFSKGSIFGRIYNMATRQGYYELKSQNAIFKELDLLPGKSDTFMKKMQRFGLNVARALELGPYSYHITRDDLLSINTPMNLARSFLGSMSTKHLIQYERYMKLGDETIKSHPMKVLRAVRKVRSTLFNFLNQGFSDLANNKEEVRRAFKNSPFAGNITKEISNFFDNPKVAARYLLDLSTGKKTKRGAFLPQYVLNVAKNYLETNRNIPLALADNAQVTSFLSIAASMSKAITEGKQKVFMEDFVKQLEILGKKTGKSYLKLLPKAMDVSASYQGKVLEIMKSIKDAGKTPIFDNFSIRNVNSVYTIFKKDFSLIKDIYAKAPKLRTFIGAEPFGDLTYDNTREIYWRLKGGGRWGTHQWLPTRGYTSLADFINAKKAQKLASSKISKLNTNEEGVYKYFEDIIPLHLIDRFNRVGSGMGLSLNTPQYKGMMDLFTRGILMKRILPIGLTIAGWNTLDTFFDINPLFKHTPLGQGLNVYIGSQVAKVNLWSAKARDIMGVTPASQYLEGLFPGSIDSPLSRILRLTTLPTAGAAIGGRILGERGVALGALLGATAGALTSFTSMTKSFEEQKEEYEGKREVPYRRGGGWLLSKSNILGDKIYAMGPSWYTKLKSQWQYTPNVYGNKLEAMLFRPWFGLGFNPIGSLINPYYYERKQYYTRPYAVASSAFSDVPIAGPFLGASIGKFVKPAMLMHKDQLAESFKEPYWPMLNEYGLSNSTNYDISAYTGIFAPPHRISGPYGGIQRSNATFVPGINSFFQTTDGQIPPPQIPGIDLRTILSEQWYRAITEPGGLYGWITSLKNVPGEALSRLAESNQMLSSRRAFWSGEIGHLGGFTEYIRRYFPNFTNINTKLNPIRNRMPNWLTPSDFFADYKYGDPYNKMRNGELFLPGPAYEVLRHPLNTFPATAKNLNQPIFKIVYSMLGLDYPDQEETLAERVKTPLKKMVIDELERRNLVIKKEAQVYDPWTNISGSVDAIIKKAGKKMLLNIEVLPTNELDTGDFIDYSKKLNFLEKQTGIYTGATMFIDASDPRNTSILPHVYSRKEYQEDINKVLMARGIASNLLKEGAVYSTYGHGYSHLDRLKILGSVSPLVYSPTYQKELQIVKAQIATHMLPASAIDEVQRIQEQRNIIMQQREYYPHRFLNQITNPAQKYPSLNLNENIKAAAQYNVLERSLGAVWEAASQIPVPYVTSKLFPYSTPLQKYERNSLLGAEFSFWNRPVSSFFRPMVTTFIGTREPVGAALSGGTIGYLFGGPLAGLYGAMTGLVKPLVYRKSFIPKHVQMQREINRTFDAITYTKNKAYYSAYGMSTFADAARRTMAGLYLESNPSLGQFMRSAYKPEKSYILGLYNTTDPKERRRILEELPYEMSDVMQYLWERQNRQNRNVAMNKFNTAKANYQNDLLARIPGGDWSGWNLGVDTSNVEVKLMNQLGLDPHLVGLGWRKQQLRMLYNKTALQQSTRELKTSFAHNIHYNMDVSSLKSAVIDTFRRSGLDCSVMVKTIPEPNTVFLNVRED